MSILNTIKKALGIKSRKTNTTNTNTTKNRNGGNGRKSVASFSTSSVKSTNNNGRKTATSSDYMSAAWKTKRANQLKSQSRTPSNYMSASWKTKRANQLKNTQQKKWDAYTKQVNNWNKKGPMSDNKFKTWAKNRGYNDNEISGALAGKYVNTGNSILSMALQADNPNAQNWNKTHKDKRVAMVLGNDGKIHRADDPTAYLSGKHLDTGDKVKNVALKTFNKARSIGNTTGAGLDSAIKSYVNTYGYGSEWMDKNGYAKNSNLAKTNAYLNNSGMENFNAYAMNSGNLSKVGQDLWYNLGYNMPNALLAAGAGIIAGPAYAIPVANATGKIGLGVSAFGSGADQAYNGQVQRQDGSYYNSKGNINKAVAYGLANAGNEELQEALSPTLPGVSSMTVKDLFGEGAQEAVGTLLDPYMGLTLEDYDKEHPVKDFTNKLGETSKYQFVDHPMDTLEDVGKSFVGGVASAALQSAVLNPGNTFSNLRDDAARQYDRADMNNKARLLDAMKNKLNETSGQLSFVDKTYNEGDNKVAAEQVATKNREQIEKDIITTEEAMATPRALNSSDEKVRAKAQEANADLITRSFRSEGASKETAARAAEVANSLGIRLEAFKKMDNNNTTSYVADGVIHVQGNLSTAKMQNEVFAQMTALNVQNQDVLTKLNAIADDMNKDGVLTAKYTEAANHGNASMSVDEVKASMTAEVVKNAFDSKQGSADLVKKLGLEDSKQFAKSIKRVAEVIKIEQGEDSAAYKAIQSKVNRFDNQIKAEQSRLAKAEKQRQAAEEAAKVKEAEDQRTKLQNLKENMSAKQQEAERQKELDALAENRDYSGARAGIRAARQRTQARQSELAGNKAAAVKAENGRTRANMPKAGNNISNQKEMVKYANKGAKVKTTNAENTVKAQQENAEAMEQTKQERESTPEGSHDAFKAKYFPHADVAAKSTAQKQVETLHNSCVNDVKNYGKITRATRDAVIAAIAQPKFRMSEEELLNLSSKKINEMLDEDEAQMRNQFGKSVNEQTEEEKADHDAAVVADATSDQYQEEQAAADSKDGKANGFVNTARSATLDEAKDATVAAATKLGVEDSVKDLAKKYADFDARHHVMNWLRHANSALGKTMLNRSFQQNVNNMATTGESAVACKKVTMDVSEMHRAAYVAAQKKIMNELAKIEADSQIYEGTKNAYRLGALLDTYNEKNSQYLEEAQKALEAAKSEGKSEEEIADIEEDVKYYKWCKAVEDDVNSQTNKEKIWKAYDSMRSMYDSLVDAQNIGLSLAYDQGKVFDEYINNLRELTKKRDNLEAQIKRAEKHSGKAIEKNISDLRAELDGVNALIDEQNNHQQLYAAHYNRRQVTMRENYFPHYLSSEDEAGTYVSRIRAALKEQVPADNATAGISGTLTPKSKFNAHTFARTQGNYYAEDTSDMMKAYKDSGYSFDAISGFKNYTEDALNTTFLSSEISYYRGLVNTIKRYAGEDINVQDICSYLTAYGNQLAGKTGTIDRMVVDVGGVDGRKALKVLNIMTGNVRKHAIGFNAHTAIIQLMNFPSCAAQLADHGGAKAVNDATIGAARYLRELYEATVTHSRRNMLISSSTFCNQRFADFDMFRAEYTTNMHKTFKNHADNLSQWMLTAGDRIVTEAMWYSSYEQAKRKGIKGNDAFTYADRLTRDAVAGREYGEVPIVQEQTVVKILAPFQVEVNNLFNNSMDQATRVLGKKSNFEQVSNSLDGVYTARSSRGAVAGIATLIVADYFASMFVKYLTGDDDSPVWDPISDIKEAASVFDEDNAASAELSSDQKILQFLKDMGMNISYDTIANMAGGSYFLLLSGWGNSDNGHDPTRYGTGIVGLQTDAKQAYNFITKGPTGVDWVKLITEKVGGKQVERFIKAGQAYGFIPQYDHVNKNFTFRKGVYTKSGNIRYVPSEEPFEVAKSFLFGIANNKNAKEASTYGVSSTQQELYDKIMSKQGGDGQKLLDTMKKASEEKADKKNKTDDDGKTIKLSDGSTVQTSIQNSKALKVIDDYGDYLNTIKELINDKENQKLSDDDPAKITASDFGLTDEVLEMSASQRELAKKAIEQGIYNGEDAETLGIYQQLAKDEKTQLKIMKTVKTANDEEANSEAKLDDDGNPIVYSDGTEAKKYIQNTAALRAAKDYEDAGVFDSIKKFLTSGRNSELEDGDPAKIKPGKFGLTKEVLNMTPEARSKALEMTEKGNYTGWNADRMNYYVGQIKSASGMGISENQLNKYLANEGMKDKDGEQLRYSTATQTRIQMMEDETWDAFKAAYDNGEISNDDLSKWNLAKSVVNWTDEKTETNWKKMLDGEWKNNYTSGSSSKSSGSSSSGLSSKKSSGKKSSGKSSSSSKRSGSSSRKKSSSGSSTLDNLPTYEQIMSGNLTSKQEKALESALKAYSKATIKEQKAKVSAERSYSKSQNKALTSYVTAMTKGATKGVSKLNTKVKASSNGNSVSYSSILSEYKALARKLGLKTSV